MSMNNSSPQNGEREATSLLPEDILEHNNSNAVSPVTVVDLEKPVQSMKIEENKSSQGQKKKKRRNILRESESLKRYTKYRCGSCSKEWWSSHGWTDYTQRCGKCGNTGDVIQRSKTAPDLEREHSSRPAGSFVTGGGHNFRLCEMCQDINRSCTGINRVKVEEYEERQKLYKNVTLIRGYGPSTESDTQTYYRRFGEPSYTGLNWIYDYISF